MNFIWDFFYVKKHVLHNKQQHRPAVFPSAAEQRSFGTDPAGSSSHPSTDNTNCHPPALHQLPQISLSVATAPTGLLLCTIIARQESAAS
uniref:Uncharacterized protein n=1 Tax=Populus trichocarpa TaxID=3694 RepID=A0A3N7I8Z2_POPTR